jgi:hypothetical protein
VCVCVCVCVCLYNKSYIGDDHFLCQYWGLHLGLCACLASTLSSTLWFFWFWFWWYCGWGFELGASHLLSRCSTSCGTTPSYFVFYFILFFWDRVMLLCQDILDHSPASCAFLHSWNGKNVPLYPVICINGVSWKICPVWPWTLILLISSYQVYRIPGLSHCICPGVNF